MQKSMLSEYHTMEAINFMMILILRLQKKAILPEQNQEKSVLKN